MNGNQEYEMSINNRIQKLIKNSKNKDLLRRYNNYINDIALSSRYRYVSKIDNFLNNIEKDVAQVSVDDLTGYIADLEFKEDGTRYSSSYKIVVYTALKHLFAYLYSCKVIEHNPMEAVKRPRAVEYQETIEKREKGFLTKKEVKAYLKTIAQGTGTHRAKARQSDWKERDMLIIMIFLNTGIRCSALMKLDVNSIDFTTRQLIVTDKGNKVRRFDLPDLVMQKAGEWLAKRAYLLQGKYEDALFISNQRKRMGQTSISDVVKKFSVDIKGKNISPHKLRATYGTMLYDLSHDIYFVQECMGHSSPKTTELYTRGNKGTMKRASDLIGKVVSDF